MPSVSIFLIHGVSPEYEVQVFFLVWRAPFTPDNSLFYPPGLRALLWQSVI